MREIISVLVHTKSYIENMEAIQYFCNATKIDSIEIYFMPPLEEKENVPVKAGKYTQYSKENRKINGRIKAELFDYIVCEEQEKKKDSCLTPVISYAECKEILRLFLVERKEFLVTEELRIDETFYYTYRHKYLFHELQNFWTKVCESGVIDDWSDALDNRLELMSICLDKCKIEALKPQNNCTVMHLKYHISYLLLLITGTFDNLAWLINNLYSLGLEEKNRQKIDLLKGTFKNYVKTKSLELYKIMSEDGFDHKIKAIRELRDRIVHRDFLQAVRGGNHKSEYDTSYLYLDLSAYQLLRQAGFESTTVSIKIGDNVCVDMMSFVNFAEQLVVHIVNSLLKVIAKEIYDSEENIVLWKMFDFPEKPYVL